MRLKSLYLALLLSGVASSAYAGAYGSLANFDVVNDTGKTAHGFEIDIEGIHSTDISSLFGAANRWPNMERYGAPVVTDTGAGVKIVYQATYNGVWSAGTPSGTLPVSPSDSCWPLGAPSYGPLYPCDHFGVSVNVPTPNVTSFWLVESAPGSSSLTPVAVTVPNPVWTVTPVPPPVVIPAGYVPPPPQVNVAIAAPQPLGYEFGEPRWVKVTATGALQDVAIEDLVAENAIIKKAQTQTQIEWQLLQVDSGSPGSGQIDLSGVALDPGATGVVYRFEFYQYTGALDPSTNEALPGPNGDTPGANGPSPGDLGKFLVAQNAGINFDGVIPPPPPLPIAPSINAIINGATVNSAYSQAINATPGVAGDTLTYSVTGLPAGLSLSGNTISGTPTTVGTYPIVIKVTDSVNGLSTSASTNLQVADSAIVFPNPFTLNQATVGVSYSQPLSVTGGYGAISFSDPVKSLPAGLVISGAAITGKATTAGSYNVTIQAKDSLGYTQVDTATLTVASAVNPPPVPCSGSNKVISAVNKYWLDIAGGLANGGQSVNYAPKANTTFVSPATNFVAGELVSYSGTLDNVGFCVATSMTVAPGLSLTPVTLPVGAVGSVYTATAITPAGGVKPYTVSVSGLPKGLSFDGAKISGTPALGSNGSFTVVVSINDNIGETVNTNLNLTINPAPAIVLGATSLPATGKLNTAYTGSVSATGGLGGLTWSAAGLPGGVTVQAKGTVSGKPTAAGVFNPVFTVTDGIGQKSTENATITVLSPITITGVSASAANKVGKAFSSNLTITGGYGALTWTATGLPSGLNVANGLIYGTPSKAGTFNPTVKVTDALGDTASKSVKLVISP